MKRSSSFKLHCKICSLFISAFAILYKLIRVIRIRALFTKTSWANEITLVRDNIYRILKSFKNSKSFENLFKFKILKWPLAVICHCFRSTDN